MNNTYRYKYNKLENKGITLISLVLTIILLIILSGITISLLLTNDGLFKKAQSTQKIQDVATLKERLELEKGPIQIEHDGMVDLETYLKQIQEGEKVYTLNSVEELNDTNAEIVVDDQYKFLVKDKENGDVEIIYEGIARIEDLTIVPTSATYTYPVSGTFEVTNNKSNGELSVTTSNENIATASIDTTKTPPVVTVTPGIKAGEVDIIVKSAANGEYASNKVIHKATIQNGTIELSAEVYKGNYDGNEHEALTNIKVNPEDATLKYTLDGVETDKVPKVTGASNYSVSIEASKPGYMTKSISKTVTIGKQANTAGNLSLSATSGTLTYPTATTFTVSKNASGGKLKVASSNTNVATASISGNTVTITPQAITEDNQKAIITVTSEATTNYEEQTATYTATVNRGSITITATEYKGNYDGKEHPAVSNVTTNPTGATLSYSLDGGTVSNTIPKVTGAKTYSIAITASKAGYLTKTETKTVTIGRQANTVGNLTLSATSGTLTYPNKATFTVSKNASGGKLKVASSNANVATASISGNTVTITPQAVTADNQKAIITVTSEATTNYEAQTATYTATVNRGSITITATAYTGTYNGQAHNALTSISTNPTGTTIKYKLNGTATSGMPTVTNAGSYTVSIEASKAGYVTKAESKTASISKANGYISLSATSGTIDTNTSTSFTVTSYSGALSVSTSNSAVATASVNGATITVNGNSTAGTATITVNSAANTNYNAASATYTVTVKEAKLTVLSANVSPCLAFPFIFGRHRAPIIGEVTTTNTSVTASYGFQERGSLLTNDPVDLTNWNYITVYGSSYDPDYSDNGACYLDSRTGMQSSDGYQNIANGGTFAFNTKTNISNVTGQYYLGAYLAHGAGSLVKGTITITSIVLEK